MKRVFILLVCSFLYPVFIFAQSNYKPGYVVNLKGDTLRGLIDYRGWSSNPDAINFKNNTKDNTATKLTATDISFFDISGIESYQRYAGPISMDELARTSIGRDSSSKTVIVFFKVLQIGSRVSLYSYTDEVKTRLFIKDRSDALPVELIYRVYNTYENRVNYRVMTIKENTYFKQLSALADKYHVLDEHLENEITHADYFRQNIVKVISAINGIAKADYEKRYNERTNLGVVFSIALNSAGFKPFGGYKTAGGKSSTSVLPAASLGLMFSPNPNSDRFQILVEGIVSANQYKSATISTGSPYVPVRYSFSQVSVALAPQAIYNLYNTPDLKVFVGLGLALTYHDYYNATYDINNGSTQVRNAPLKYDNFLNNQGGDSFFKKISYPAVISAGARFGRHFGIFARYFTASEVSGNHYFRLNYNIMQAGINYSLY